MRTPNTNIIGSVLALLILSPAALSINSKKNPALDFCPTCVSFMGETLDELINIIANIVVISSCEDLCGYLQDPVEEAICNALCSSVGLDVFIGYLKDIEKDPDPIYMCQELSVCPVSATAQAKLTGLFVDPPTIQQGGTIQAVGTFLVTNTTGTGQVVFYMLNPEDKETVISQQLIESLTPGVYPTPVSFNVAAGLNTLPLGNYSLGFQVCEGTCGSTWPDCRTFGTMLTGFFVFQNDTWTKS